MIKAVGAAVLALTLLCAPVSAASPKNTLYLDLEWGRVVIEMLPAVAPKHVARIKQLVRRKFYDGLKFHRVIRGFMAQTGDPQGNGTGGSGQNIPAEFSTVKHLRGTLSMARASNPNSADSQFFIVFAPAPFLDGKYTVWGQVKSGMEHVDRIRKGLKRDNGAVGNPDRIVRMRIAADVDK
jgi:peptidylprolyl isomerase